MSTVTAKIDIRFVFDGAPPEQEVLFDLIEKAVRRAIVAGEFTGGLPVKETNLWAMSVKEDA